MKTRNSINIAWKKLIFGIEVGLVYKAKVIACTIPCECLLQKMTTEKTIKHCRLSLRLGKSMWSRVNVHSHPAIEMSSGVLQCSRS